jgi:transcriptional regulator with XRE-family HTH domain
MTYRDGIKILIKKRREELGLTQTELAKMKGVSIQHIFQIEKSDRKSCISIHAFPEWEKLLQMDPGDFLLQLHEIVHKSDENSMKKKLFLKLKKNGLFDNKNK